MSGSVPKQACQKRLRNHEGSTRNIQSFDEEKGKNKMERADPFTSVVNERKMMPYESTEMTMQQDVKQKKNVSSDMSKEKKTKATIDCNYERRKKEQSYTQFKKVKRMQSDDNYKNIHSGKVKEKNCGDGEEKKWNKPFSFFKVICNNFKESLTIPPTVVPELEDLTNHHVYLEDSEGNFSKIRLSVVDGSLAFHRGWNIFVSDHLIKWGEFLLFEYTAKSTFSVRVFGRDSRERLHFNLGRKKEGFRKKEMHTKISHDDLISFDVKSGDNEGSYYGEYPRNEYPKRVESTAGSGPLPLDSRNGDEVIRQSITQVMSPLHSKEKRIVLVMDSGSSVHENNIVELITSTADTNEDPKRVQNGIGNEKSAVVGAEKKRLTAIECGTKCTSPKHSVKKAVNSVQSGIENAPSAVEDEKGSLHENDNTLKEDLDLLDSNEDLRRKQEINSINLECPTAVNKCNNDDKMNFRPENHEAPGVFRCLEKWRNRIVRHRVVLDGTGLTKPESTRENDSKFVVEYGEVGLKLGDKCVFSNATHACSQQIFTMPIKDPARPERVSMCEHDGTESIHNIDGKGYCSTSDKRETIGTCSEHYNPTGIMIPPCPDRISKRGDSKTEVSDDIGGKGTVPIFEANMGNVEPMDSTVGNILVCENNAASCQSEHCFYKQDTNSADFVTPEKPEILESDYRFVLKINLRFCIRNTTWKWLELPKPLSNAFRQRKQGRSIIMLKDPMKRLWPVFYHENSIFVGFTAGWKHFAAANDLQIGDLCEILKEPGDAEPVYYVRITKK